MRMRHYNPAERCARALLSLFRKRPDLRLSKSEQRLCREEVNEELSAMGDDAIAEALNSLYLLAEADARRKARELARAMAQQRPV